MSIAEFNLDTLADLVKGLGNVPLDRIRLRPAPGTATPQDVLDIESRENRLCELVDGVLVEKVMGYRESLLATFISMRLNEFVIAKNLGLVTGADGMVRLFPDLVRIPDVAFASWAVIPGGVVPEEPIPDLAPELAIEVLSRSNTAEEMTRKRGEYFQAEVKLVWFVDPDSRTVTAYQSPDDFELLSTSDTLTGDPVLPGFAISLQELFAQLDRTANQ